MNCPLIRSVAPFALFLSAACASQSTSPTMTDSTTASNPFFVKSELPLQYPPFDSLLSEDFTTLPSNHPDERLNYDGSFTMPTISTFPKTLYDTAAIFDIGNSSFSLKLSKNDDDVLAERALVNARRLAVSRRERAHVWYALSRRRRRLKIKLRELQVDHAIKTYRRPKFCNTKNL